MVYGSGKDTGGKQLHWPQCLTAILLLLGVQKAMLSSTRWFSKYSEEVIEYSLGL